MKKVIALLMVLVLCVSLTAPAFASEFVPSISYKDHPEVVITPNGGGGYIIGGGGEIIEEVPFEDLIIIPVSKTEDYEDEFPGECDELEDMYESLLSGDTKLPYELVNKDIDPDTMVIRDLFYVLMVDENGRKDLEEGTRLQITLNPKLDAASGVVVMVYYDGAWHPVNTTNNGDGTVTIILEHLGIVSFSVPNGSAKPPVQTGDNMDIMLWVSVLVISAAALTAVVVLRRKQAN